jgi:hypothetical protein
MKGVKSVMKKFKVFISLCIIMTVVIASFSTLKFMNKINAAEIDYNYAKALQYSQYFYDANMCGTEVDENSQYSWRGDCHTYDETLPLDSENTNMSDSFISEYESILDPDGDNYLDVAGGFHDAGDHVKFGMPQMYTGSTLGWGFYEFKDQYVATEQDEHIKTILRYFNDYFMKSTYLDDSGNMVAFCYQVGDGDVDHAYWNAPEIDEMFRRGWFANEELPSTDVVTAAAASLAVNYMNFKDEDPEYAEESLKYAKVLFEFAENTEDKSCNSDGPKGYYVSSKWEDDYCWAASWLYLATEDDHYLEEALTYLDYYAPPSWTHCWNDVWAGTMCILSEINDTYDPDDEVIENRYRELTDKSEYEEIDFWGQIAKTIDNWMDGTSVTITDGGYAFLNQWGSARYNTATQLLALVYDKHNGNEASEYSDWAKSQMDYLIGDNPAEKCYIVGYSDISVKYPHHRAASGLTSAEDTGEHRYVLYGALVGGPDSSDNHIDATNDYIYNEVAIDYNAAFVGACAGLYNFYGDSSMEVTPDFPPAVDPDEEGGNDYWVEAFCVDIVQDEAPKASELTFYVYTDSTTPSKNVSVRYYFDSTGMTSLEANDIELRELYDQTSAETEHDAILSGPHQYEDNIYYVEVSWEDYSIANSNKKYQFALGTYAWQNYWDPSDDWSHTDIKIETDAWEGVPEKTDYICVYDDGVLVGGIEPDGTVPEDSSDPEETDSPTDTTTDTGTPTPTETEATETPEPTSSEDTETDADIEYSVLNDWGTGATIEIAINNNTSTPITSWTLDLVFSGNQEITNSWNCEYEQTGTDVVLTGTEWNASIPANGSISFGFNCTYTGTNEEPTMSLR